MNRHENMAITAEHAAPAETGQVENSVGIQTQENMRWLGMTIPKPISDIVRAIGDFGQNWRRKTIQALPSGVVNHSSNMIAGIQLVGEGMMLKANNTQFIPPMPKAYEGSALKKAWHYISSPPKSVFQSVFSNARVSFVFSDLGKASFYKNTFKSFTSLEDAAKIDSAGGALLMNRWQARSTFAGLTAMLLTAAFPDVKDTEEQVEERTTNRHNHPLRYTAKTIGEALWFPVGSAIELTKKVVTFGAQGKESDIGQYKRQFTGLGLTIAGLCSFLSGFRNVGQIDKKLGNVAGNLRYVKNGAHSFGGAITAFAGTQLLLSTSSDQGWERFGSIQWLRMISLPRSISNRYKNEDPRAHWYLGGQVGMQTSNTASFLIGGAEKLPDGTIVDHKDVREEAKQKVLEAKAARRLAAVQERKDTSPRDDSSIETPMTKISQATIPERAMPEREAPQQVMA